MNDLDPEDLLAQGVWLRRLARALTGESHADDVLQETYAAALVSPPQGGQPLRPWLAAVLRNFAHMMFRGERRRRARETRVGEAPTTPLPTPEALLASHQAQRLVAEAVEALDEPFRSTVLLCYVEGLTPSEVARKEGIPAGTVRWRLKRALELIRARLEERHGGRRGLALLLAPLTRRDDRTGLGRPGRIGMTLKLAGSVVVVGMVVGLWSARHRAPAPAPRALALTTIEPGATSPRPLPAFRAALTTDQGGRIEGTVRDEARRPVRGATVAALAQLSLEDIGTGRRPLGPAALAVTDDGGHYRLDGLAPGTYGVTATAAGLVPAHLGAIVVASAGPARADLALGRGAVTMRGRVLDVGGGPVAAARIMAIDFAGAAPDTTRIFVAVSDGRGEYRLSLARRVRCGLAVDADGYAQTRLDVETLDADRVRDLTLKPAAQVSGRVVDGAGSPVAGSMVRLARQDGTDIPFVVSALSDDRGEFLLRGLIPASYRLWARKGSQAGAHPQALAVRDADRVDGLVLSLQVRPSVSGRVLTEAGQPVAGAQLWFSREEGTTAQEPRAVSDGEGRYRIEGVLPGAYDLRAVAPGFAPGRTRVTVESADLTAVDLGLATEARLFGRVLTAAGAAAPSVRVLVLAERRLAPGDPAFPTTRTLADGTFRFDGVQPGKLRIGAEDATLGLARATTVWTVGPGQQQEVTLRLEPGATLSGRVRRTDGSPASAVVVTGYQGPTGYATIVRSSRTGRDGAFALRALGNGEVRILATAEELPTEPRGLPPGAAATIIKLAAGQDTRDVELTLPDAP